MRSIVIAFLVWQCFPHRPVSCIQSRSTTPSSETTHSGLGGPIAYADMNSRVIVPKAECRGDRRRNDAKPNTVVGCQKTTGNFDMDLPYARSCIASRYCDTALNERCVAVEPDGYVCGCGEGYRRNRRTRICELAPGVDPNAVDHEAAWREHLRMLYGSAGNHSPRFRKCEIASTPKDLLEDPKANWIDNELERINEILDMDLKLLGTALADEQPRCDYQDHWPATGDDSRMGGESTNALVEKSLGSSHLSADPPGRSLIAKEGNVRRKFPPAMPPTEVLERPRGNAEAMAVTHDKFEDASLTPSEPDAHAAESVSPGALPMTVLSAENHVNSPNTSKSPSEVPAETILSPPSETPTGIERLQKTPQPSPEADDRRKGSEWKWRPTRVQKP